MAQGLKESSAGGAADEEEPRQEPGKILGWEGCQGEGERLQGSLWSQDVAPSPSPLIQQGN